MEWLYSIEFIGFIAAFLGTISLIPQVLKTWKSKSVTDISIVMYLIISIDSVLWLIYGGVLNLMPLIVQSCIILSCAFAMVVMKLLWR